MVDDVREVEALERRLLDAGVRADVSAVAALLDDELVEFGVSGRVYDKRATLEALGGEAARAGGRGLAMSDVATKRLAPDLALVTYRVIDRERGETARTSVWIRRGREWRMLLHQGFERPPLSPAAPLGLRAARPAERAALENLQLRASLVWPEHRAEILGHPDAVAVPAPAIAAGEVRVAERDAILVGFSWLVPARERAAELEGFFVDPEAMRTGVGRALFQDLVAQAPAREIEVTANPRALDFYAALGFVDVGVAETAFGPARRMRRDPTRT